MPLDPIFTIKHSANENPVEAVIEKILISDIFKTIVFLLTTICTNLSLQMHNQHQKINDLIEFMIEANEYMLESHNYGFIPISGHITSMKLMNWQIEKPPKSISTYVDRIINMLSDQQARIKSYSSGSAPQGSIDSFMSYGCNNILNQLIDVYLELLPKVK